jgi:YgiT-type zinc finger domain-containing protein
MNKHDLPTTCPICGGSLEETAITHDETWGNKVYRFEQVPALVCTKCGEVLFTAEVNELLEALITRNEEPDRYEEVRIPVFTFSQHFPEKTTA